MRVTTPGTREARRLVVGASLAFAALLVGGSWLLFLLRGVAFRSLWGAPAPAAGLAIGAAIGLLAGFLCGVLVARAPALSRVRLLAREAVAGIDPRWHTVLVVAVAAGVSEELFFRGALEPAAGPWLTALAFVALHGALRIRGRESLAFAAFLGAASLALSELCAWRGLEAAMAAHAGYDAAVLASLGRLARGTGAR